MKIEIVAKRMAANYGYPPLEKMILGELPPSEFPAECITWTGAIQGKSDGQFRLRKQKERDYSGLPYFTMVPETPYGKLKVDKKTILAHRYLFQLLLKPDYEFRLRNECGNTLCGNLMHWECLKQETQPNAEVEIPEEFLSMEFSLADVEGLLDRALIYYEFSDWSDIEINPLLLDCPRELLIEALKKARKDHLLP